MHKRMRDHQPHSNRRRKHWRPEGAICHEGRDAEVKKCKGNCPCQHGYAPNKGAAELCPTKAAAVLPLAY